MASTLRGLNPDGTLPPAAVDHVEDLINAASGSGIELRATATHIQWRPTGGVWANLVSLADLEGGAGPANSLSVGTITTLPAGESATATITGTPPSQTLDLGIPQGADGEPEGYLYVPEVNVSGTLDLSSYTTLVQPIIHLRLTGNITSVVMPSSPSAGLTITLVLKQDGTGGRTITLTGKTGAWSTTPTLTATPSGRDVLHLMWIGTEWLILPAAVNIGVIP